MERTFNRGMPTITIRIPEDAEAALRDLARAECRTPRDQASFLVVQGLRARVRAAAGRRGSASTSRPGAPAAPTP